MSLHGFLLNWMVDALNSYQLKRFKAYLSEKGTVEGFQPIPRRQLEQSDFTEDGSKMEKDGPVRMKIWMMFLNKLAEHALEDLDSHKLKRLKTYLSKEGAVKGFDAIPRGQLDHCDAREVVSKMKKAYGENRFLKMTLTIFMLMDLSNTAGRLQQPMPVSVLGELFSALDDLDSDQLKRFKAYLSEKGTVEGLKPIPFGQLEQCDASEVAPKMKEAYGEENALGITLAILRRMNLNLLASRLERVDDHIFRKKTKSEKDTAALASTSSALFSDAAELCCECCAEVTDTKNWVRVEPEVSTDKGVSTYSLSSSDAGSYECSLSGLRWLCPVPVTLQYHFMNWHVLAEELVHRQCSPAGPLMDIKHTSGKLEEIHLPHFLCLGGSQSALKDAVKVLHKQDSGVCLETCELTRHHAKIVQPSFSLLGLVFRTMQYLFPPGVHCELLLFRTNTAPLELHVYLVPNDPAHIDAIYRKERPQGVWIDKPSSVKPLRLDTSVHVRTSCQSEIQPRMMNLWPPSTSNYAEVYIKHPDDIFDMDFIDTAGNAIFKVTMYREDFQDKGADGRPPVTDTMTGTSISKFARVHAGAAGEPPVKETMTDEEWSTPDVLSPKVKSELFLFCIPGNNLQLHVYLVQDEKDSDDKIKAIHQEEAPEGKRIRKPGMVDPIPEDARVSVWTSCDSEIQPDSMDLNPSLRNYCEVYMEAPPGNSFVMAVKSPPVTGESLWKMKIRKNDYQQYICPPVTDTMTGAPGGPPMMMKASGSTDGSAESASKYMSGGVHFIDKHLTQLIKRVTDVHPILDHLKREKVISQEFYSEIQGMQSRREKMRKILAHGNIDGSPRGKDILYEALLKEEPFLMKELTQCL